MKKYIAVCILLCLGSIAPQLKAQKCEQTITYMKASDSSQAVLINQIDMCYDAKDQLIERREFGDGRVLFHQKYTYNKKGQLVKEAYAHGYESNDGGEGVSTYKYKGDTWIQKFKGGNFSSITQTTQKTNAKGLITFVEVIQSAESELLPEYNYDERKSTTKYEYNNMDSLTKEEMVEAEYSMLRLIKYNEKDLRQEEEYINKDYKGELITHQLSTYAYNEQGLLIAKSVKNMISQVAIEDNTYSYKDTLLLTAAKKLYELDGTLYSTETTNYEYNTDSQLLSKHLILLNVGTKSVYEAQTIYKNGRLAYESSTTKYEDSISSKSTYEFDELTQNLIKETYQSPDYSSSTVYSYEHRTFKRMPPIEEK
ncbi:MAG: hypothetical protein EAZ57_01960 [Cytophagales bacterium]|nr:MAG: hypothetical protein EAZ67_02630 [Cytophagales bacterium]TAF61887.1 MAG: hypothetical protein EAZ57_01960 [Cytophagales bacterium]